MQVTLWIQPVSQLLDESFINNQFSASPGYPSLFSTRRERGLKASLESANCTLLHSKWLPCTAIGYRRGLSTKTRFRESNSQKASSLKNIYIFLPRDLWSVVWWWWPLTGYCEIPRCRTPRICLATSSRRKCRTCFSLIFFARSARAIHFFPLTPRTCAHFLSLCLVYPVRALTFILSVRRHLKSDVFVHDSCVMFRWCVKRKLRSEISGKLTVAPLSLLQLVTVLAFIVLFLSVRFY